MTYAASSRSDALGTLRTTYRTHTHTHTHDVCGVCPQPRGTQAVSQSGIHTHTHTHTPTDKSANNGTAAAPRAVTSRPAARRVRVTSGDDGTSRAGRVCVGRGPGRSRRNTVIDRDERDDRDSRGDEGGRSFDAPRRFADDCLRGGGGARGGAPFFCNCRGDVARAVTKGGDPSMRHVRFANCHVT